MNVRNFQGLFISILFLFIFAMASEAHAATIVVDRTDDVAAASACTAAASDCSLRGAFAFANATTGTVITLPAGTYLLTGGELVLGNATNILTTLNGAGSATTTIQQNTVNQRVIDLNPTLSPNVVINITGIRITGGNSPSDNFGGGGLIGGGAGNTLNISNCLFENNSDVNALTAKGGGIEWAGGGFLNINNCTFNNNTAGSGAANKGVGGGVDYQLLNLAGEAGKGGLTITNSTFTNNRAGASNAGAGGGLAIAVTTTQTPRTVSVTNNTFTGNQANAASNGHGGAITSSSSNALTIKFNRITDNTATGVGTGMYKSLGTLGSIDATQNWWACNQGPTNVACDTIGGLTSGIDADPHIILSHTPNTNPIVRGQSSQLTASFLSDSAGGVLSAANISRLIGLPIAFGSPVRGTLSAAQTTIQAGGTATALFTANATGAGSATATVDAHAVTAAITIQKGNTTISMNSAVATTVVGQSYSVSFNAPQPTAPATGTPTGTVTVSDGSQTCQATLPATSCNITSTTAGAKNLTATYNGDTDYNASPVSAPLAHTVNKANTTTAINNITPSVVFGQTYTVSASTTIDSPGSGTLTGTINVTDGTNNCAIALPATTCNLPATTVGLVTVSATYAGNTNFNASPTAQLGHTIGQAQTTTTIVSTSPNPSTAGQNVVVTYSVTVNAPGAGTPTGTVTVSDGTNSCVGTVAAGQCTIAFPVSGSYTLTATYSGETNFAGGSSIAFSHQVCGFSNAVISNTNDSGAGSMREALAGICAGGTITFSPDFNTAQTIMLTGGEIALNRDIVLNGPGANLLTIDANDAGRVFNITGGNVGLSGMTITGGNAANGGGIANLGGTLTLTNSVVTGNVASDLGGGIYSTSALTIVGTTVSNNTANSIVGETSGGIHSNGPLTVINSTVSGNSAPNGNNSGGGIRVEGASSIINATIANNIAVGATSASGMLQTAGLVTLRNTIVAGNQNNATVPDAAGAFDPASAYNLIGNVGTASGFSPANQNQTGTGTAVLDPRIGTLNDNGGATPTHAISLSSPAVDKGSAVVVPLAVMPPLTTDQRGFMRPVDQPLAPNAPGGDGSDIGAYELLAPTAARVGISGRVLTLNGSGLANATVVLSGPDGEPRIVRTSLRGDFHFEQVEVGRTYSLQVNSKPLTFNPQTMTVQDEITGLVISPEDF